MPEPANLPEPSIELAFNLYAMQALVNLGLIPNPATGKSETSLPEAKFAIDMLEVFEAKTAGNLTAEEAKTLRHLLQQARMTYLGAKKQAKEKAAK